MSNTLPQKSTDPPKLPTLAELVQESETTIKANNLVVLLNQPPPDSWLLDHPMVSGHKYLPVQKVEFLLTKIFTRWWVEIKSVQSIANSAVVTLTLFVQNPLNGEIDKQDGVGAAPIHTSKGKGAMDWNEVLTDSVMKAVPAAESYAFKDAAEKFGKIFGKDLGRKSGIDYNLLLKEKLSYDWDDLQELYNLKGGLLPDSEREGAQRILNEKEITSYHKLKNTLKSL